MHVLFPGEKHEHLFARSAAVIAILRELSPPWRLAAAGLRIVPKFLRDWIYNFIARHRYKIFGRRDRCILPADKDRHKFLDIE